MESVNRTLSLSPCSLRPEVRSTASRSSQTWSWWLLNYMKYAPPTLGGSILDPMYSHEVTTSKNCTHFNQQNNKSLCKTIFRGSIARAFSSGPVFHWTSWDRKPRTGSQLAQSSVDGQGVPIWSWQPSAIKMAIHPTLNVSSLAYLGYWPKHPVGLEHRQYSLLHICDGEVIALAF